MRALVMIERPGRADLSVASAAIVVGALSGFWLTRVLGGAAGGWLPLALLLTTALLSGWANAASP